MKLLISKNILNAVTVAVATMISGGVVNADGIRVREVTAFPTLKNGLLAWYSFDGDLNDACGMLNAQIANGNSAFSVDRFGHQAGTFRFDGKNALSVSNLMIGNGSFTIQFWTLNPTNWLLGQGIRSNYHGLHIGVNGSDMRCDYWGDSFSAPLSDRIGWTHWVITHDAVSKHKSMWRDGKCVAQTNAAVSYSGDGLLIIGRHFSGGGYFVGSLDDLAFWNRALTVCEITNLYADGQGLLYRLYPGVPYQDARYRGGAQLIPGKLQNEYYDTLEASEAQKAAGLGEGITYHDTDNKNSGSGDLNGRGSYNKEFRISESPDISYTKFNNPGTLVDDSPFTLVKPEPDSLYLGWIAPGEWVKYTVDVQIEGDYALNILFTSKFGGHISLDSDGVDITGPLAIPSTAASADTVEWRQAHHWDKINNVGKFHLRKGRQVLTLHFIDKPVMNFDYMEFVLVK